MRTAYIRAPYPGDAPRYRQTPKAPTARLSLVKGLTQLWQRIAGVKSQNRMRAARARNLETPPSQRETHHG